LLPVLDKDTVLLDVDELEGVAERVGENEMLIVALVVWDAVGEAEMEIVLVVDQDCEAVTDMVAVGELELDALGDAVNDTDDVRV
jgi:hypothetical protein